ncbi:hypothetical protein JCM8208_005985 [Rhodotorula glutinis]
MAPVNATPLSQRTLSPFDDTPTRAPSSGHSSLNPLTSLKPQRTRSLSSFASALRPNNSQQPLADPIEADNTELHRRRVEASFQRQLDSLANANRHLSDSSASSDHDHGDRNRDHEQRRRFNDESASSSSSSRSHGSRSSDALSLGSLRIGLTGSAPAPASSSRTARGVTIEDVEDGADSDSDGHLTYVTERASVLDSPAQPRATSAAAPVRSSSPAPKQQQQQPPARTAAAAPSGGLFGSPRPSVLSHMHAAATSSPRRSSDPPPPRDENLPPSPAARPSPSFGANGPSSYPSVAPPRTVLPPSSFSARSPFSPATGPRIGAAAAAGSAYKPKHYSPLNPALNSPLNASPAASTVRGAGSRVHSPTSLVLDESEEDDDNDEQRRMADRTTRTALPDRTGLTDMLRSPKARRGEPAVASASARRASPAGSGTGSGRSAEANLVSTALAGLTSKLASLERDNAQSAARVAELEARLAAQQQERPAIAREQQQRERDGAAQEREEQAKRLRREVETMLGEERDRRAELERVVQSLRAQNAHLDATLSAQHAALASLRTAAAPAPAPATAAKGEYALRTEVQDLKHALAALGYEVDGVRTVVEELLRDKEARDAGRRWDAEEAERRAALDELSVEGAGGRGQDEGSRSSFVAPSEVERLVREQEEEVRRRRRASTGAQRPAAAAKHVPHRPAAPVVHAKYDSTYVPSVSDSAGSRSSASLVSATSATSYATSASADAFDAPAAAVVDDEPDFARAQRIFDDVQAVSSPPRARRAQPARAAKAKATAKPDRVVLVDEPSAHLCTNCHGRKSALRTAGTRRHDDVDGGADADEEDLAFASGEAEARRARAAKKERRRAKEEAAAAAEAEAARVEEKRRAAVEKEERRRSRARDEHRRTLEGVLDRLEGDFAVQKKLYLELTAEYQSMASRADTRKRRVLASHLKGSIDVLEDKAREVKRYADALEDLYEAMHEQTCPRRRKAHATI